VKEATFKAFGSWRILFPEIHVKKYKPELIDADRNLLPPRLDHRKLPSLEFDGKTKKLAEVLKIEVKCASLIV